MKKWLLKNSVFVLLLLSILTVLVFLGVRFKTKKIPYVVTPTPVAAPLKKVTSLLKEVDKKTDLPNEIPNVATITDRNKLQMQPFLLDAKNGDKILIYTVSKVAILYRPSTQQIIKRGTLAIVGASESARQASSSAIGDATDITATDASVLRIRY